MNNQFFELGFDHYRFNLPLETIRFSGDNRESVNQGYNAAEIQQVTRKRPSVYEKKLMVIKDRALVKGLEVSITAKGLESALFKTKNRCPVTGEEFSFSEGILTDWSVDRVNNDRGYEPNNIVIVSVKVNQAKSNLDLEEMIEVDFKTYPDYGDLDAKQWRQMVAFYYGLMELKGHLSFSQLLDKQEGLLEYFVFSKLMIKRDASCQRFLTVVRKHTINNDLEAMLKLGIKRVHKHSNSGVDILFNSPKLRRLLKPIVIAVRQTPEVFDVLLLDCLYR
jgi:hypothetical protein